MNAHPQAHIWYRELKQVNMLPVVYRITHVNLNHMHNIIHGQAPRYLTSEFSFNSSRHNTRSGPFSLHIPQAKSLGQSSFKYTASADWNNLPNNIKNITTKSVCKSHVKCFLFSSVLRSDNNSLITS